MKGLLVCLLGALTLYMSQGQQQQQVSQTVPQETTLSQALQPQPQHVRGQMHHMPPAFGGISNRTIAGDIANGGCKHSARYETTGTVHFQMCVGQNDQDLKNGMSIINVVNTRGYLPTCRILQLLLWMSSEVHENKILPRDSFVDIGANIGSCSVAIASLGFPVVSVEPVQQHVDTIRGTIHLNPSFHIEMHHLGICVSDRKIKANFGHGSRNWGATFVDEVTSNSSTFETELRMKTTDQVVGNRKVSLMKIDCEGCEWAAIKGARRTLKKIPMLKIELVQPDYTAGNETVKSEEILQYLNRNGFDIFMDLWAENSFYFGHRSKEVVDTDRMFGNSKFQLGKSNTTILEESARRVLQAPIDPATFNRGAFLKRGTDVIAIEKTLAEKMKLRFLPWK